jgi:hypothetical protein
MIEFCHWLSMVGNAILAIPIIVAVWGICIIFDCFEEDDDSRPEDQDYD